MKTIFIIFVVALACASATTGGVSEAIVNVPVDVAESDPELQSILSYAQDEFIKRAYESHRITSPNLFLSKIESVYTQVIVGENVTFNVEFTDPTGAILYVTLGLYYQPWDQYTFLTSYNINSQAAN